MDVASNVVTTASEKQDGSQCGTRAGMGRTHYVADYDQNRAGLIIPWSPNLPRTSKAASRMNRLVILVPPAIFHAAR